MTHNNGHNVMNTTTREALRDTLVRLTEENEVLTRRVAELERQLRTQKAIQFIETYADKGPLCAGCKCMTEGPTLKCGVVDKLNVVTDCPALPDELYP